MLTRQTWLLWIGLFCLSGMFLMGQNTWPPEEDPDAKLLEFVNHCSTTANVLNVDVGLGTTAANNIVSNRDGADGVCDTTDDDPFDSADELDAVPYVGTSAMSLLRAYAATWEAPE